MLSEPVNAGAPPDAFEGTDPTPPRVLCLVHVLDVAGKLEDLVAGHLGRQAAAIAVGPLHRWPSMAGRMWCVENPVQDRTFWEEVLAAYRRSYQGIPFPLLHAVQERCEKGRRLIRNPIGRSRRWEQEVYHNHTYKLAHAVAAVAGCRTIVDSSERPGRAGSLLRNPCLSVLTIRIGRRTSCMTTGMTVSGEQRLSASFMVSARDLEARPAEVLSKIGLFVARATGSAGGGVAESTC